MRFSPLVGELRWLLCNSPNDPPANQSVRTNFPFTKRATPGLLVTTKLSSIAFFVIRLFRSFFVDDVDTRRNHPVYLRTTRRLQVEKPNSQNVYSSGKFVVGSLSTQLGAATT